MRIACFRQEWGEREIAPRQVVEGANCDSCEAMAKEDLKLSGINGRVQSG
jgi:hypothetical protein